MKRAVFFSSSMAPMFRRYMDLKRALGCDFSDQCPGAPFFGSILEGFHQPLSGPNIQSISTMVSYSGKTCLGLRRYRMRTIYNFCLYRRRTKPHCFSTMCRTQKDSCSCLLLHVGHLAAAVHP